MTGLYDNYNIDLNSYNGYGGVTGTDDFGFKNYTTGDYPTASGFSPEQSSGLFDSFSTSGFADIAQGLGGLYQMYQGNQQLGLARDDLSLRKEAYRANRVARDKFTNNTTKAFG